MLDPVVSQAKTWGFICQRQESNLWQINPQQTSQKWQLEQVEDRWILLVEGVPQLCLDPEGAIAFLETRRQKSN